MLNPFLDHLILNSPYACPQWYWELDPSGSPTRATPKCDTSSPSENRKKARVAEKALNRLGDQLMKVFRV